MPKTHSGVLVLSKTERKGIERIKSFAKRKIAEGVEKKEIDAGVEALDFILQITK